MKKMIRMEINKKIFSLLLMLLKLFLIKPCSFAKATNEPENVNMPIMASQEVVAAIGFSEDLKVRSRLEHLGIWQRKFLRLPCMNVMLPPKFVKD